MARLVSGGVRLVSLQGDFYFRPATEGSVQRAIDTSAPAADPRGDVVVWGTIQSSTRAEDFRLFLEQYPNSPLAPFAESRLAALTVDEPSASLSPERSSERAASAPQAADGAGAAVTSMGQTMVVGDVTSLNVRDAPGGSKIGSLRPGMSVKVTGRAEHERATWYRIARAGGLTGWVFGKFLEERSSVPTPAVGLYPRTNTHQPGASFKDCGVCPEMVVVPAGSFLMGSPGEGPRHRVTIPAAFAVGKFEVTFAEWDACAAGGGCDGYRPTDQGWGLGLRPVINVSWE